MLLLLIIVLVFKPVYDIIDLLAQHAQNVALDRLYAQKNTDLKANATAFKNIIASLNGCTTPDAKQKCIDDHTEFIDDFCKAMVNSIRPRCLGGSVPLVLMFQQRLFAARSVPNQWMQEFADRVFQVLMVCAHAVYVFGEIRSEDMIDELCAELHAFTMLHSKIRQEQLKSRREKTAE
jgi:hypothetical protein